MSNIFPKSLPASLARRLAEAADGIRNVDNVYFVAGYKFPHPIKEFYDLDSAEKYFKEKGFSEEDYDIFGPYKTEDALKGLHFGQVKDIEKIHLTIHYEDGHKEEVTLHGCIDSIFLNLSSLDKFIFPYYCGIFGADYAKELRDSIIARYTEHGESSLGHKHELSVVSVGHAHLTLMVGVNKKENLP